MYGSLGIIALDSSGAIQRHEQSSGVNIADSFPLESTIDIVIVTNNLTIANH